MTMKLMPRRRVPTLEVDTVDGGHWSLGAQNPQHFTMIVFYRGLHCAVCQKYLSELNALAGEFGRRGVSILVASTDAADRAKEVKRNWQLSGITVGYGVSIEAARAWGLYISSGRGVTSMGIEEPSLFAEPGLFLVQPDGALYFASVGSMPFARPHFSEILRAIDFVIPKNYPARGDA